MTQAVTIERRIQARECARNGRLRDAISILGSVVSAAREPPSRDDHALLALYHFNAGAPLEAARLLIDCHEIWPEDSEILKNIGICYSRGGGYADAKPWLLKAVELDPGDANLHDALADVFYRLGDVSAARDHGARALLLKDASAGAPTPDPRRRDVPIFDDTRPQRNVIAYSLWGQDARYLEGALTNARLAPHLYPGWRCRFYVDGSVPDRVVGALLANGADIVRMPDQSRQYEGLFWRFRAAFDADLDRFLVRDADSVIDVRERLAVDAWLDSGAHFHVMRDHVKHTDLILGGLWGGVAGALPDLSARFADYLDAANKTANCDQLFLRQAVWPNVRESVLVHDSQYRVLGAHPFPAAARQHTDRHVGQDASVHPQPVAGRLTEAPSGTGSYTCRRRFVFTITPGRTGTAYLTKLLRLNCPDMECHHERTGFDRMGVHNPDASTFMLFNSRGNVTEVRDFWRRKFALIRNGPGDGYVEISHFLGKAGLVENLDLLGSDAAIDLIDLRRDLFQVVWSYANRFDFANNGFTWLFSLDPAYPRRIVDPARFRRHGMFGSCLWYALEMFTRAEYYRRMLRDRANLRVHTVDLDDLTDANGVRDFLERIALTAPDSASPSLPAKTNHTRAWPLGEKTKADVKTLVERLRIDPAAAAEDFVRSGGRLA